MPYKILEQNGVDNENIDGGAFNNFAAGGRDGIIAGVLAECMLTATGNAVGVSPGLLVLHGIRVKLSDVEMLNISSVPQQAVRYQIVAQIILESNRNIAFTIFLQSPKQLKRDELYSENSGTYQIEIGQFTHNPDGSISELIRTADVIFGGAGASANLEIGEVVTDTLEAGLPAGFDVTLRCDKSVNKTFLDFYAGIPKGLGALSFKGIYDYAVNPVVNMIGNTVVSNFNRTPIVGERLFVVIRNIGNGKTFSCEIVITGIIETQVNFTITKVDSLTGADGRDGDGLSNSTFFSTADNIIIIAGNGQAYRKSGKFFPYDLEPKVGDLVIDGAARAWQISGVAALYVNLTLCEDGKIGNPVPPERFDYAGGVDNEVLNIQQVSSIAAASLQWKGDLSSMYKMEIYAVNNAPAFNIMGLNVSYLSVQAFSGGAMFVIYYYSVNAGSFISQVCDATTSIKFGSSGGRYFFRLSGGTMA